MEQEMNQDMANFDNELRKRVRDSIEGFIDIIAVNREEPPTKTIKRIPENEEHRGFECQDAQIPEPSQVVNEYKKVGEFEKVSQWMFDEKGILNSRRHISRGENGIEIYNNKTSTEKEKDVSLIVNHLRWMAGAIMDYNQDFEFTQEAFEAVYESWSNVLSEEKYSYTAISPLKNFESDIDQIPLDEELSIELNSKEEDEKYQSEVLELKISKLTKEEREGIYTWISSTGGSLPNSVGGSHKIEARINAIAPRYTEDILFEKVLLALRLFDPESDVDNGSVYRYSPTWQSGHQNVVSLENHRRNFETYDSNNSIISRRNKEPCIFVEEASNDMREFWQQYNTFLPNQYTGTGESDILRPLERFNQMYSKSKNEDALIDCSIGFETTLIKDGGRIPARGTVLLAEKDFDNSYIYKFLDEFWNIRNNIVHGGENITNTEIDGENHSPNEIVRESRNLLANSIIGYMDLKAEHDKNITEINRDILRTSIANHLKKGINED